MRGSPKSYWVPPLCLRMLCWDLGGAGAADDPLSPKVGVCRGEDQSRGRGDSGRRPLVLARDILKDRGLGISAGSFVSFLSKDVTNRLASGKGSCWDEMRLGHVVSIWKATSGASREHRVRCCVFKLGNI